MPVPARRLASVLLALVLVGTLAACSSDTSSTSGGYVAGDGGITIVGAADREEAPDIAGTTLDGERLQLSQFAGKTIVVNVWGSWCAPCRKEAPDLVEVSKRYADQDVQFVGIVIRDDQANAIAFQERFGLDYPSILDPSSQTLLGFARSALPSAAIPTTWVIDDQGRVAARALDEVTASTLAGVIDDVKSGKVRSSDG